MKKLVVDSSVAIEWFVVEPYITEARLILDQYKAHSLVLLAPDLINAEVGNIVWKKHIFQGLAETDGCPPNHRCFPYTCASSWRQLHLFSMKPFAWRCHAAAQFTMHCIWP